MFAASDVAGPADQVASEILAGLSGQTASVKE